MSNVLKLKKRALELEQKKQLDRALELYIQLLDEAGRELEDADVPLFNRVGDLLIRQGKVSEALGYYERAVDFYAERGYLNNAIALCNKILRQSPGRTAVYYKLGRISASKGFRSDARKNFLEYADRVQKTGDLDEAFRALKEFATLYPDEDDIRLILAEQLSKENRKGEALEQLHALYEKLESEGRQAEARATLDRMQAIDPAVPVPEPAADAPRNSRSNDLIFLDLSPDERPKGRGEPGASASPGNTQLVHSTVPALDGLSVMFVPDDSTPRAVSAIARVEGLQPTAPQDTPASQESVLTPIGETAGVELTGEFDVVGDLAPATNTATPEADAPADAFAGPVGVDRTMDAGPQEIDLIEPAASTVMGEQPPLSGVEFAELALAEIQRPAEPRTHDLALPSELPLLEREKHSGTQSRPAADSLADEGTGEQEPDESAADSSEASPRSTEPVFSRTGARNPFDLDVEGFDDDLPTAGPSIGEEERTALFREVLDQLAVHHAAEEPSDVAAGPGAVFDDLLQIEPRFGSERTADGPAFSSIPGLSEERSGRADPGRLEPAAAPNTPAPFGGANEGIEPNESVKDEPTVLLSTPRESAPVSADEVKIVEGRVDSPLPPGLRDLVSEGDVQAHSNAAVSDESSAISAVSRVGAGATLSDDRTPRATVSIGSAERHLRRRLELEPENWTLRRQLGEALLDTGNRDEGLYELDVAMAGFELSGDLARAQEIADEAIRVLPASVRHHQKRVEYAVRAKDRARLIDAYLELADALFRLGAGDKSVAVYARVLELSSENERALFALATLAPDHLERVRTTAPRPGRWTDELGAIAEGGTLTQHAPPTASSEQSSAAENLPPAAPPDLATSVVDTSPAVSEAEFAMLVETPQIGAASGPESTGTPPIQPSHLPLADQVVERPAETAAAEGRLGPAPEQTKAAPLHADVPANPRILASREKVNPERAPKSAPETSREAAPESVAESPWGLDKQEFAPRSAPIVNRTRSSSQTNGSDADFVDLGEWLRQGEPEKSTRMVVDDAKPTGDERADFEDLLRRFKRGVAENVDAEDFESHYDLGVAFKEMGLIDEAIAEFQKALRGTEKRVRSYEALGQCFVEKEQYPIAAALMQRAVETPGSDDQVLVGVLYLLGFAHERAGRPADALRYYQRVFAVDLEFRDISQRVSAMEQLTK